MKIYMNNSPLLFFRFPKGDIGDKWVTYLRQFNPSFEKKASSNVCGLHFDPDLDYEISRTTDRTTCI